MPTALRFEAVTKVFPRENVKTIAVLEDISFDVASHEIFCLVGPSGCGKTTLLNIAAGFVPVTSGAVLFEHARDDRRQSRCGYSFQADAVFPWMTVAENVRYGLRWNGTPPDQHEAIVAHHLEQVGLSSFARYWPRELSGGMRKRVDLARALAIDPAVLLLDEPFGSLDVMTKARMQRLLLDIWRGDPKTVVFITHDVEEAVFLGHRVAVMSAGPGRIQQIFTIPFAMEERIPSLKLTPHFVSLRRDVLASLGQTDA